MPFKRVDMEAEGKELQELLSSSEEAQKAHRIFNDEYNFRLKIAKARKENGLTQNQIKEKSGLTQQVISRIEKGSSDDRSPTLRTILRYLDSIDCELVIAKRRKFTRRQDVTSRRVLARHKQ